MNCKRFFSLLLAVAMLALSALTLAGCGDTPVMSLTVDGETYTITTSELDFIFPYMKWQMFYNNGWTTYTDVDEFWSYEYEEDDGTTTTFNDSITASFLEVAKTLLIEKYLYVKYGSPAIDSEDYETYKTQLASMLSYYGYGKEGYYKKYWGYTTEQEMAYYVLLLRNTALSTYLFGDDGIIKVTDEEKEEYYNENYVAYEYIMLDMNNAVSLDEEGNRVRATESSTDDEGITTVTELDEYVTTELTDEEKEEKKLLADTIAQKLKDGESFESLVEKYSDDYDSHKFTSGSLFVKGETAFNTTVDAALTDFEVGDYTEEGVSISNDAYVYFVKRVELVPKAYDVELYEDATADLVSDIESDKLDDILSEYEDMVVVDEKKASKYSVAKAYLSEFVNSTSAS